MNLKILQAAHDDLINGHDFYQQQQAGIGDYFLDSLFADIDSLLIYQGVHPVVFNDYRRMLARHFPFAIYYRIEAQDIVIYAVLDTRKKPAWTKGRIDH